MSARAKATVRHLLSLNLGREFYVSMIHALERDLAEQQRTHPLLSFSPAIRISEKNINGVKSLIAELDAIK